MTAVAVSSVRARFGTCAERDCGFRASGSPATGSQRRSTQRRQAFATFNRSISRRSTSLRRRRKFDHPHATRYIYKAQFEVNRPSFLARLRRDERQLLQTLPDGDRSARPAVRADVRCRPAIGCLPGSRSCLAEHAEAKYHSFRHEIDADVFTCLASSTAASG